jgi:hypothetical protein
MASTQYVSVLPDGSEQFEDVHESSARYTSAQTLAQNAVLRSGMTTPRSNPVMTDVEVFKLSIDKGQLVRSPQGTFKVEVPLADRTEREFNAEMAEILLGVPKPFRDFVSGLANEHASNYDEIIGTAEGIADSLSKAIRDYDKT